MTSDRLILKQLELGPMMNIVYIIGCPETKAAAVVDPAWDVPEILKSIQAIGLELTHILVTHAHPDHVNGLEELLEVTEAPVYLNSEENAYVFEMAKRFQIPVEFMQRHSDRIHLVADNEEIRMGTIPIRCLHTPGHTPGSQCFLIEKHLLSGDTLFVDGCGRVDLPGGDPEKMWWSLNHRLRQLDDDILLHPGHDYAGRAVSTMGDQKRTNPYMQYASAEQFRRAMG